MISVKKIPEGLLVFDRQERSHHPSPIQAFPFYVDDHPYHSMLHKGQNPENANI